MTRPDENETRSNLIAGSLMSLALLLVIAASGYELYQLCRGRQVEYKEKLAELHQSREDNRQLAEQNRQLRALVRHLKTNEGVEEIARDKLGLIKPGELAYVVVPSAPVRTVYETVIPEPIEEDAPGLVQQVLDRMFDSPTPATKPSN